MEKAYRGGHELANDASPLQTDQMRFVKLDKEFVGRDALVARADRGEASVIAYLDLGQAEVDVLGGEAVFFQGVKVGSVSSGGFGPVTARGLAFAFVTPPAAHPGTVLEVMIFGQLYQAEVLPNAVLDPENLTLRDVEPALV